MPSNPADSPKVPEVNLFKKQVLREKVEIYRQSDNGCLGGVEAGLPVLAICRELGQVNVSQQVSHGQSELKILVSVVRFRPRPPNDCFGSHHAGIAQLVERYLAKV